MSKPKRKPGITFDPKNARTRDDRAKQAIMRSLTTLGAGRSIVLDKAGVIVAGNGVYAEAKALGLPVRVVESDGKSLVVVKRTDLGPGDPKRTALAIADNQVATLASWDEVQLDELRAGLDQPLLDAAGFGAIHVDSDWEPPPPDIGENGRGGSTGTMATVLRLGDYRVPVEREAYMGLVEGIKQVVGFDEASVMNELLRRIGAL